MQNKETLQDYRMCSTISSKRELYQTNGAGSRYLFAFRAGCVATNIRVSKFKQNQMMFSEMCGVCNEWEAETSTHILRDCQGYTDLRTQWVERMQRLDGSLNASDMDAMIKKGLQIDCPGKRIFDERIAGTMKRYLKAVMERRAISMKKRTVEIARRMCAFYVCLYIALVVIRYDQPVKN